MKREQFSLWKETEYNCPSMSGYIPTITTYLHTDERIRPAVIIAPGGGYRMTAPGEAEPVAERFYREGYQAFVVVYSVVPAFIPEEGPLGYAPLKDFARAMRTVRSNHKEWHVDPQRVAVCGFSAGAHLAGSLSVDWDLDAVTDPDPVYAGVSARPDASILCYPVITSGKYAHADSFVALLGMDALEEKMEEMSLEKQVRPDMAPVFLWQTADDDTVPVENSYLFAQALRQAKVPFEHHVFSNGPHGMGLADADWKEKNWGDMYPLQTEYLGFLTAKERHTENSQMQDFSGVNTFEEFCTRKKELLYADPNGDVRIAEWPTLATGWLQRIWSNK